MIPMVAIVLVAATASAQPQGRVKRIADRLEPSLPRRTVVVSDALGSRNGSRYVGGGIDPSISQYHDDTPRITADGRIMYFNSTRFDGRSWAKRKGDGSYDSDIYYSIRTVGRDGEESWSEPVNLGPAINTGEDDAIEAISPSGGTIYFTSFRRSWVTEGGPIYRADLEGTQWKNVRGLGGGITQFFKTSNLFRIYGASVGAYGDVFYFATTAHSPSGDQEIWVSHMRNGMWSYPKNLGATVNAGGGSFAPYIAADGKTLYFSSGRRGGYGAEDVYVTVLDDTLWQEPVNLGSSINTSGEDSFFSIPASGDRIYLTRMHNGVATIISSMLEPQNRPTSIVLLTGTVVDKLTGKPVAAVVTIEDLQANTTVQRSVGSGLDNQFATILLPGRDYGIAVSAPGYGFHSTRYTIPSDASYKEVRRTIELERLELGRSFALNNIFFDYDSDSLRGESHLELDRLVGLLDEYPRIRIMVSGHTDNIGSPSYNEALSRRRASAVQRYLLKSGRLDPSRIEIRGYGASMPVAPNDTEEGRQKNRVVQFTIVTM